MTPIVDQHEEIRTALEALRARERVAKMEAAACTCDGGSRLSCPVHREEMFAALRQEAEECGLVLITAGSLDRLLANDDPDFAEVSAT